MNLPLANAGVPMLALHLPAAVALLLPIILIETTTGWATVRQKGLVLLREVAFANAISTIVGVPMTWALMFLADLLFSGGGFHDITTTSGLIQSVVVGAAWLAPYEWQLYWLVPAATLVLLVPYFFVSVFFERWWLLRRLKPLPRQRLLLTVWIGNTLTYSGLFVWCYAVFWQATASGAIDLPPVL
ncbi:MAG: hypothetical protein AAF561_06690 [Planctomycetota bacterium]